MKHKHNADRTLNTVNNKEKKIWGVYDDHRIIDTNHPLVAGMNSRIIVPHTRWNDVSEKQFLDAGHNVLISSPTAGVHLAETTNFKWIMMQ